VQLFQVSSSIIHVYNLNPFDVMFHIDKHQPTLSFASDVTEVRTCHYIVDRLSIHFKNITMNVDISWVFEDVLTY